MLERNLSFFPIRLRELHNNTFYGKFSSFYCNDILFFSDDRNFQNSKTGKKRLSKIMGVRINS